MRRGRPSLNAAVPRLLLVATSWGKFAGLPRRVVVGSLAASVNEDAAGAARSAQVYGERRALPRFGPRAALILPIGYVRRSPLIKGRSAPTAQPRHSCLTGVPSYSWPRRRARAASAPRPTRRPPRFRARRNSVAKTGLEPVRPCGRRILNPLRLPIPPLRLAPCSLTVVPRFQRIETKVVRLEVRLPPRGQDSHGTPDRVPVCRRRASSEKPAPSQQRETYGVTLP